MKRLSLALIMAVAAAGTAVPVHGDPVEIVDQGVLAELRDNAFQPWFDGLRNGDLNSLRPLMDEDVYVQYQTLFEQNTQYGQFLRDYYAGASFQLVRVLDTDDGYLGETLVSWPDGSSVTMSLLASRPDESDRIVLTPK